VNAIKSMSTAQQLYQLRISRGMQSKRGDSNLTRANNACQLGRVVPTAVP
jgi:hypothetical protein